MRNVLAPIGIAVMAFFIAVPTAQAKASRQNDPFFLRLPPAPKPKMFLEQIAFDLGASGHSIGTPMYGLSYLGPELQPFPWIDLGFGLEYGSGAFRKVAAARIIMDPFVSAIYYSDTSYGQWYRAEFYVKPAWWVGLGTASDSSDAIGPYLSLQTPDKEASIDGTLYYPLKTERSHGDLTLRIHF